MNIFTTDHPMSSRESETRPLWRNVALASFLALMFTPWVLDGLYEFAMRDLGAEPVPFPNPWLALGVGTAVSFVASFLGAFTIALVCRRVARSRRPVMTKRAGADAPALAA